MIVVNLFGAPGSGKSTGTAYIFSQLKLAGYNCELITEFAKDMVWERNKKAFANQMYIFGQQNYRLSCMNDEVDIVITDSPLPMSILYLNDKIDKKSYTKVVLDVFNQYNNLNFFIYRSKPYNPKGRNQTKEESDAIAQEMVSTMLDNNIKFEKLCNGEEAEYENIVQIIKEQIRKERL